MTLSERLQACAVRVRQGWCQDALHRDGGVCALGAMLAVDGNHQGVVRKDIYNALSYALGTDRVIDWNNAPDQTAENVAQTFELAALLVEQKQAEIAILRQVYESCCTDDASSIN